MDQLTPEQLQQLLDQDSAAAEHRAAATGLWSLRESLFGKVKYEELSSASKTFLAKYLLVESCSGIGSLTSNGDVFAFLNHFSRELASAPAQGLFGPRKKNAIVFAVGLTSTYHGPDGPAAVSSVYLCVQLELFFRVLGGYLDERGRWQSPALRAQADAQLPHLQLMKSSRDRINSTSIAY